MLDLECAKPEMGLPDLTGVVFELSAGHAGTHTPLDDHLVGELLRIQFLDGVVLEDSGEVHVALALVEIGHDVVIGVKLQKPGSFGARLQSAAAGDKKPARGKKKKNMKQKLTFTPACGFPPLSASPPSSVSLSAPEGSVAGGSCSVALRAIHDNEQVASPS
jgi:hypothetical protein